MEEITIQKFIDKNYDALIKYIRHRTPKGYVPDRAEIRQWVVNDSNLYNWMYQKILKIINVPI